jgi:6-phosphogluconolactonase
MTRYGSVSVVSSSEFSASCADEIVESVRDVLVGRESCSLCLTGGTTPAEVYRNLTLSPHREDIAWGSLVLLWGDERYFPHDHPRSNFFLVQKTLISRLGQLHPTIEPFPVDGDSPTADARKYSDGLRSKGFSLPSEGGDSLDITLLGVGEDGHFASIFPHSPLLMNPPAEVANKTKDLPPLAVATYHPETQEPRLTLVPPFLLGSKRIIVLVKGEQKRKVIEQLFSPDGFDQTLPISVLSSVAERVLWIIDSNAAGDVNF